MMASNVYSLVSSFKKVIRYYLQYDTLRKTLVIPRSCTLQNNMLFIKEGTSIQPEVTLQLLQAMKFDNLEDHQKYVSIVFDEMKIKEGLVYDKHECKVIGFVDVGTINNTLQLYKWILPDKVQKPVVAKHMFVFKVRGLFITLQFPYAQHPTTDFSADILCNPKFFKMYHKVAGKSLSSSDVVYKVRNPYSRDERNIYSISDVPHLIKTVCNAYSNSFGHNQARAL